MFRPIAKIPAADLAGKNRLYIDYLERSASVRPYLEPIPEDIEPGAWRPLSGEALGAWKDVATEVLELTRRLGGGADVIETLGGLSERKTRLVVTGQQPGVLGGPLYAAYKIATAVALAARIERASGMPCVALYWCGADDTDFGEVRDVELITADLAPVTASIAQKAHRAGMPVGDIETSWIDAVWEAVRPFAESLENGAGVASTIAGARANARDHGEFASAILMALLGGRFGVVDGRSGAVRRFARRVFVDYLADEDALKGIVSETGGRLEASGYHAQLAVGSDSGVFLMEGGLRRAVPAERREVLTETAAGDVAACAPGVVVRNLVQDYTFEPAAVVLGPAEIAYRAQISALYGRFGIARPCEFPRLGATFVPPRAAGLIGNEEAARAVVADANGFVKQVYRANIPDAVGHAVDRFTTDVLTALARLSEAMDSAIQGKTAGKWQGRVKDFRGRVEQLAATGDDVGKTRALGRWPFLPDVARWIMPGEKPQERRIASIVPYLFDGGDGSLVALAQAHVDELMDGRASHVVYSV